MNEIGSLPLNLCSWLATQPALQGLTFITQYPAQKKQIPLRNAVVSLGIEHITLEDAFGEDAQGQTVILGDRRIANIRLCIGIYVPYRQGGQHCHELFCAIMERLIFASYLYVLDSGCGAVKADRDTDAFVLQCYADVSRELLKQS